MLCIGVLVIGLVMERTSLCSFAQDLPSFYDNYHMVCNVVPKPTGLGLAVSMSCQHFLLNIKIYATYNVATGPKSIIYNDSTVIIS